MVISFYEGDGNFSFSLCLAKCISRLPNHRNFELIATSFDAVDDLIKKYPECMAVLIELSKYSFVTIQHGVNAANLQSSFSNTTFHLLFFNFPHLAREDCIKHSSFIAHCMNRCAFLFYATLR